MARMYPRTLIPSEVKSEGEKRAFDSLRDGLDDDWRVFHSARAGSLATMPKDPTTARSTSYSPRAATRSSVSRSEGGGLERQHGEWFRTKDGERERFHDPFAQALDDKYDLARALKASETWKKRDVHIVHALWFPDITVHKLALPADATAGDRALSKRPRRPRARGRANARVLRGSRDKRALLERRGVRLCARPLSPTFASRCPSPPTSWTRRRSSSR